MQRIFGVLAATLLAGNALAQSNSTPPPSVVVATVSKDVVQIRDEFVGRVVAKQQVDLQARVKGVLQEVEFTEGGLVSKGDVLFRIEQTSYKASVDSAKASVKSAEATALSGKTDLDRKQKLFDKGDIPQAVLDAAKATYAENEAEVDVEKAALRIAEVNLGYTEIISPLDGRIGLSAVDAGNIVSSDTGVLATVNSVDPILVRFFVSERVLLRERKRGLITPGAIKLTTQITLADGSSYPTPGKVTFVDTFVSEDTDTIELQATYANPDGILLPGQFVSVILTDSEQSPSLTVPRTAVQFDKSGHFVFVVNDNDTAHRKNVEVGNQSSTVTQIKSGLSEGDRVVVQGLQKIHDGLVVNPVDNQS